MRQGGRILELATAAFPSARSARNVAWNLVGGASTAVFAFLATPWYVARLGLDGYGIVGVWLVMQVMLGMLDLGMGATVVRSFAGAPSGEEGERYRRELLRTLEIFYWGVAAALSLGLAGGSDWVGRNWLKSTTLSHTEMAQALRYMAIALGVQFPSALYTSGLAGRQAHGRMNALQILGNAMRYGGGGLILLWRPQVVAFFAAQAVIASLQTAGSGWTVWHTLGKSTGERPKFRPALIRQVWRYSAGMALSAAGSVSMANADRIALSALLPTSELGKYAVAFTATGLLQLGIQPFYRVFFPRFSELVAAGQSDLLRKEYFRSCQLVATMVIPLGIVGFLFAPQLLRAWLGRVDPTIVLVFRCLLVAISCTGLMWLPAAFQQAHGWTKLHAGMIIGALILGAPVMLVAIRTIGTVGATTVWLFHGISGITLELWLMHRRLLVGALAEWYRKVLVLPAAVASPIAGVSWWLTPAGLGRWGSLAWVAGTASASVIAVLALRVAAIRAERQLTYSEVG